MWRRPPAPSGLIAELILLLAELDGLCGSLRNFKFPEGPFEQAVLLQLLEGLVFITAESLINQTKSAQD